MCLILHASTSALGRAEGSRTSFCSRELRNRHLWPVILISGYHSFNDNLTLLDPIAENLGPHMKPVDVTAAGFALWGQLSGFLTRHNRNIQTSEGEVGDRGAAMMRRVGGGGKQSRVVTASEEMK